MKVIIHDLDNSYDEILEAKCDRMIAADGKYAACQGCFGCWTKHPAECFMKDKLRQACRIIGIPSTQYSNLSPPKRLPLPAARSTQPAFTSASASATAPGTHIFPAREPPGHRRTRHGCRRDTHRSRTRGP